MKIFKHTFALLLFLTFLSCSDDADSDIDTDNPTESTNPGNLSAIELEILQLVNEHRNSIGLNTLTHNAIAYEVALEHTNYMISRGSISHDNFSERFDELTARVNARSVGENVAFNYRTASDVVQGWLDSPGHRENIEGNYTHTAIVVRENDNGSLFFTNIFYR